MAYETKVILTMMAEFIGRAKSLKEVYNFVVRAANVEGVVLPSYEEFQKQLEEESE
ncbi:MAG: hypothetical protein FWE42_02960 [Defluviitaleaceae bacterium]|nr:hypothetical protein [Defluviitaleaceae bacterium]